MASTMLSECRNHLEPVDGSSVNNIFFIFLYSFISILNVLIYIVNCNRWERNKNRFISCPILPCRLSVCIMRVSLFVWVIYFGPRINNNVCRSSFVFLGTGPIPPSSFFIHCSDFFFLLYSFSSDDVRCSLGSYCFKKPMNTKVLMFVCFCCWSVGWLLFSIHCRNFFLFRRREQNKKRKFKKLSQKNGTIK